MLIERTNKAEFYRLGDGSLLKQYFTKNAAEQAMRDQRSLRYLQKNFGEVCREGWLYRSVRFHWSAIERASICMEFVPGCSLAAVAKSKMKEAEYHCGIWMALYHNKIINGCGEGLIYTDFNAHNVILDFEQKWVTAIDPGFHWGRTGYTYEDLLKHIDSVLMTLVVRRKAGFSAIVSFLKGYASVVTERLNFVTYYKSFFRQIKRQTRDYAAKSYLKCLLFPLAVTVLSPFYLLFVPGYLFLKSRLLKHR